jgi:autotransporter-associated beta strand protein
MLAFCLGVFMALGGGAAFGAAYTWDPTGSATNFGGAGTWATGTTNWWNGTTTAAWASGTDAWFTGPASGGTVTLANAQSVGNLVFNQTGYTLTGGSANVLTLTGGSITTTSGTATINSPLAGSVGLTKLQAGTLSLGASNNTLTGTVTVNAGVLYANGLNTSNGALGTAGAILINNGGTISTGTAASNSFVGSATSSTKSITINAGGAVIDTGSQSYHLNALILNGGTISAAANNTSYGSWNFDQGVSVPSGGTSYMLGGNAALTQNSGGGTQFNIGSGDTLYASTNLAFGTSIASSAQFSLVKAGNGTLILAGSNNFTSSTIVNAGTLLLANVAALKASPLIISAGTVSLSGINSISLVSLSGSAAGTLLLTNTDGSSANLTVAGAPSTAYNGTLTGSGGSLTMAGPGTLTLGGSNNYTGTTTLGGGVLVLNNSAALAGGGPINFTGGTLRFTANNKNDYSPQFLTTNTLPISVDTNGQNVIFAANLVSPGGSLTKLGAGQLTLSGNNTYSGVTNINAGLLVFSSASAVPSSGSPQIIINSTGALSAISGDSNTVNGWLNTGDIATTSVGAIALSSSSTDTSIDFTSGPGYPTLALGAVGTVTYGGTINPGANGSTGLGYGYYLGGSGTLWLSAPLPDANGVPTQLTVTNGGTVVIANSASSWSGPTIIQTGATLQLGDGVANTIIPVNSISNSGTLTILNLTAGTIAAGINGPGQVNAFGTSVLELDGANSTGVFYANGGTVNINGLFSTTNKTVLGSNVGSAPASPTVVNWNATGTMTGGSYFGVADTGRTATLNFNGGNLAVSNVIVFVGNGGGAVSSASNGTFNMNAGIVTIDASNPVYLSSIGTANTFGTGTLNISGGSMYIAQGTNVGQGDNFAITMAWAANSTATINLTGGTLSTARGFFGGSGTSTVNLNGGVLECAVNSSGDWFDDGVKVVAGTNGAFIDVESGGNAGSATIKSGAANISGPGFLTKLGPGTLTLNNSNTYQGSTTVDNGILALGATNLYTGGTVLNGGLIQAQSELSLGPVPGSFMYNNITLNGGELRDNSQGASLNLSANRGIYLGPNGGFIRAGWGNTTAVNGVISGSGSLGIATDGQGYVGNNVYLANPANTYTSGTTIGSAGQPSAFTFGGLSTLNVLKLANGGLLSSIGQSTSAASNLVFNAPSGGTSVVNYVGTGDSTDRLFTIASGAYAAINSSGTGPLNFTNPGAIVFTNAQASTLVLGGTYAGATANTFAPQITDNGALPTGLAVNGSLWTLTGSNNTFTGSALISGGTLNVTSANELQNNTVSVNGGNLAFAAGVTSPVLGGLSGSGNLALQDAASNAVTLSVGGNGSSSTFSGNLSGPGGLFKTGGGLLTIAASQNYAGATVVNSGTLQLAPTLISGFGGNGTGWALNKSATAAAVSGNVLTLTTSSQGGSGASLWFPAPQPVTGGAWTATFAVNDVTGNGADGGAFVLQTSGTNALGGTGGQKGFGAGNFNSNEYAGMVWELFNSSDTSFNLSNNTVNNTAATTSTTASGVNLRATNTPTTFTVSYNGNGVVTATLTQGGNVFGPITYPDNLSTLLSSNSAYIGFVGADGGTPVTQQVSNFSFQAYSGPSLNQLPTTTPMQINAGGTFDLNGGSQTIASLSGVGTVTNSSAVYPSALTIGNLGTSPTFSGTITGNLSLIMAGNGVQTLAGVSSYTGTTTINGGALMYATAGALPTSGAVNVNYGGGLIALGAYSNVNQWLTASPTAINPASTGAILLTPNSADTDVNFAAPGYNTLSLGALGAVSYGGTIEPGANGYYFGGGGGTLTLVNAVNDYNTSPTALTVNGPGMVVLAAAPGYSGSTTVNSGGVLDLGGNTLTTSAAVALQGGTLQDGTVISTSADYNIQSGYISANLGGGVNLTKTTTATATLAGANTYTGVTNINGGILNLGSAGAIPAGGTIAFGGGTMQFSSANTTDYSGQIVNSTAPISIDPNGQSVTFATALAASNMAGLTLNGTGGTLTLSVPELYSGTTTVNSGFLALTGSGNILPATGNIVVSGGTLDLGGNGQTTSGTVSFQGGVTQNGTITNNTVAYDGRAGTVTASLAGSVGLNKTTAGFLNLISANSYSGSTALTAGVLSLGNNASLGSGTLALGGGTLQADTTLSGVPNPVVVLASMTLAGTNSFTLGGNLTNSGANHTLTMGNVGGSVVTISGNIYISESQATPRDLTFNSNTPNTALVLSGNISDSALGTTSGTPGTSLTIQPNDAGDTVLISGTNTYTGTTSLGGAAKGIITFTNSAAFGASTVSLNQTQIQPATNLALSNNFTTSGADLNYLLGANSLTINGSFTNTANASFLNNGAGLLTLTGNIYLTATSIASNSLTFGGSGETILSGPIANFNGSSGTVDTLAFNGTGGGILYITGTNNSYNGTTDISAGTVNVASLSNYGVNSSLGARLALSETSAGDGIGIHIGSGTTGATLQYTGSTAQSTNRQIRISAANNTIDASGSLPSATMSFTYSGTNVNLYDTGGTRSLTLTGSNTGNNLFAINIQDQSTNATSLIKSGVGTWVVTNSANGLAITGAGGIFSGFSGGTTINAGMLIAQAPGAIGEVGKALNLAGGTLDLQTNSSINALNTTVSGNATIVTDLLTSGPGITQNLGTLHIGAETLSIAQGVNVSGGAPAVTFGATTLTGSATFSPAAGTTLTLGSLSDGGTATTATLSGAGTVVLSAAAASLVNGAAVNIGSGIALNSNNATALGGVAAVQVASGGTLNLGASQTIGSLSDLAPVVVNGANVNLNGNALTIGASNNLTTTFSGVIANGTASGSLIKAGTGTLTLAGSSTYSGPTTISAGVLNAAGAFTLSPNSAVAINGGALNVTAGPQTVASLSVGSLGSLDLYLGNLLASTGTAGFASGSTLNLSGSIGALPELLMTYLGSPAGSFSNLTLDGGSFPSQDQLSYSSGSLEIIASGPPTWTSTGGNWSNPANWSGTPPNAPGQSGVLNASSSANVAVTLDIPITVGALQFGVSGSATPGYTLSGNTLTFNNSGSPSTVSVLSGSNTIAAPVSLVGGNLVVAASNSGVLGISGNIADDGNGRSLVLTGDGSGELILSGNNSYTGGTSVLAGTLVAAAPSALPSGSSLSVGQGASSLFAPSVAGPAVAVSAEVAAVPEPSTLLLLAIGAALLAAFLKLRR